MILERGLADGGFLVGHDRRSGIDWRCEGEGES